MNATTVKHLQAIEMITTHHVRHIFIPWLNVTIQSHSIKDDCYKPYEKCWIVATINPISCSCTVHHDTFFNVLIDQSYSCKCRGIIIFMHNYLETKYKQSNTLSCITIKYIFLLIEIHTSFFLQSILTLIVQTIVSAV